MCNIFGWQLIICHERRTAWVNSKPEMKVWNIIAQQFAWFACAVALAGRNHCIWTSRSEHQSLNCSPDDDHELLNHPWLFLVVYSWYRMPVTDTEYSSSSPFCNFLLHRYRSLPITTAMYPSHNAVWHRYQSNHDREFNFLLSKSVQ
jgi:hypothetical protein